MDPLQKLWPALEGVAGLKAVLTEWRRQLGLDFDLVKSLVPRSRRPLFILPGDFTRAG